MFKAGGRAEVICRPLASSPYDYKLNRHGVCRSADERVKNGNYSHLLLYLIVLCLSKLAIFILRLVSGSYKLSYHS